MKPSGIISSMPTRVAPVEKTEDAEEHLQNGDASRHGRDGINVPHPIPYQGSKRNLAPAILGYVMPKEHLGLPNKKEVKDGVIVNKIATPSPRAGSTTRRSRRKAQRRCTSAPYAARTSAR